MHEPLADATAAASQPRRHLQAALLQDLTAEQAAAVTYATGPLLIIAGPGAGKTRTLIHRITWLLTCGLARPWEILAVTFSVRAAGELRLRLADLLGEQVAAAVTAATFHSVCARMLREDAALLGRTEDYTIYDQADMRHVIEWVLSSSQRGAIQAALTDYGQPAATEVLAEISLAKNRLLSPAAYERSAHHSAGPVIAEVWREAEEELRRSNAFSFDDLLVGAVQLLAEHPHRLTHYRERWKWIVVDEFQDTNEAQGVLIALLVGPDGNVCAVADDDQCLVEGTMVRMADGTERLIEQVRPGDRVLSGYGLGRFRSSRVLQVHMSSARECVAITTASGRTLLSTAEHIHFAGYRLGAAPAMHLTYLMWREGVGFRVGTTRIYDHPSNLGKSGLALRVLQEHVDAAWVLSVHADEVEARLAEAVVSLRYGLPTQPFVARPTPRSTARTIVGSQATLDRLHASLDTTTAGHRLLSDEGLSFDHPHHTPQSAAGRRRYVTVALCDGKSGAHRLRLNSNDPTDRRTLEQAGYPIQSQGGANWRIQVQSGDVGEIVDHARRISGLIGGRLRFMARLGRRDAKSVNTSLPFMPASAVRPGMTMFNGDGGYEIVVRVERVAGERSVYDLDIERTHNYIANGVITHNSIYAWRGAEPRNVLEFGERFPGHGRIVLGRNFRSRSEILNAAVACVSQNERRTAKALIAVRGPGGRVQVRTFQSEYHEAHWIAGTIGQALVAGMSPGEILVLARASYATEAVQTALAQAGIPHRVLGSLGLYERSEIRDALAYLTLLVNPADAQAFRRAVQAPRRGVGSATITQVVALARERHHGDLIVASVQGAELEAVRRQSTRDRLAAFGAAMERVRGELRAGRSVGHVVVSTVMIEGGLVADHQHRRDHASTASQRRDAERVLEDLRSLCRAAQHYDSQHPDHATLTGFLEMAAGLHAQEVKPGQEDRRITVSTVHRAKGTEAALVFLAGCEERLFPTWRALQAPDIEALCEERRVFYVACTRAKDGLFLTYAHNRGGRPTAGPSQFLYEAGLISRTSMAA